MIPVDRSRLNTVAAGIAALLLLLAAVQGWSLLAKKTAQQRRETAAVARWQAQRDELAPVAGRWRATFPSSAAIRDLAGLHRALRIEGLTVDPDTLAVAGVHPETDQGVALGVSRLCVRTAGTTGLEAGVRSASEALAALTALTARPDLRIGGVTLALRDGKPVLRLDDLCLVVRESDDAD
ncbi:hypothetical protein [Endothiovibrio diazotrophicus]